MSNITVSDSIRYIGADDLDIDLFESQYVVPNGISYNSYVILDDKITVMDTIDKRKTDEWLENLEKVLDGKKPDYLVVQHLEPDHAASLKILADKYPEMKLVGNVKTQGLHEMQDAAGRGAGARNISGVGRDLGFNQYNMQHVKNSLPAVSRQASIFYDRTSQISTVFQKKIKIFVKKIFPLRRSIFGDSYTPTAASRSRGCRRPPGRR